MQFQDLSGSMLDWLLELNNKMMDSSYQLSDHTAYLLDQVSGLISANILAKLFLLTASFIFIDSYYQAKGPRNLPFKNEFWHVIKTEM